MHRVEARGVSNTKLPLSSGLTPILASTCTCTSPWSIANLVFCPPLLRGHTDSLWSEGLGMIHLISTTNQVWSEGLIMCNKDTSITKNFQGLRGSWGQRPDFWPSKSLLHTDNPKSVLYPSLSPILTFSLQTCFSVPFSLFLLPLLLSFLRAPS